MANLLATFSFEGKSHVRTIQVDGRTYFVASDVAGALGYEKARNAVSTHCKGALKQGLPTAGGVQEVTVIPESDVYRLVMRSKLQSADRFQDWVVEEVLPSIRQTGAYAIPLAPRQEVYKVAGMEMALPRNMADALRGMAALSELAEDQATKIQVLQPKAAFHDAVALAGGAKSIREVAQVLGTGQNRFFKWLRSERMLLPSNLPYQAGLDAGHFKVIEQQWQGNSGPHVTAKTLVTAKGLIWIQKRWVDRNPALRTTVNLCEVMDLLGLPRNVTENLLFEGWAAEAVDLSPVVRQPESRWDQTRILELWAQIPASERARYRKG